MTIPIEPSQQQAKFLMSGGSRYLNQTVIYYGEQRHLTFDTYIRENYKKDGNESVMLITKGTEYRPDLIAYDIYGFPNVWWKILEVNGMKDIWEFKAGKTIILPSQII